MIGIVAELATNGLEVRLLQGGTEGLLVLQISAGRDDGAGDQHRGIIILRRVIGGIAVIFLAKIGNKFLVGGIVDILHPLLRADMPERQILQLRQGERVDGEGTVDRNLPEQSGLRILLNELHTGLTGVEDPNGVGLDGAHLGKLGRKIDLSRPARIFLPDHLALERFLDAGGHVLARGVVRRQHE